MGSYLILLFGAIMFRLFITYFVFIIFASLSTSFNGVQASKKEARELMEPSRPYQLYMPSPFEDFSKDVDNPQDRKE